MILRNIRKPISRTTILTLDVCLQKGLPHCTTQWQACMASWGIPSSCHWNYPWPWKQQNACSTSRPHMYWSCKRFECILDTCSFLHVWAGNSVKQRRKKLFRTFTQLTQISTLRHIVIRLHGKLPRVHFDSPLSHVTAMLLSNTSLYCRLLSISLLVAELGWLGWRSSGTIWLIGRAVCGTVLLWRWLGLCHFCCWVCCSRSHWWWLITRVWGGLQESSSVCVCRVTYACTFVT